MPRWIPLAFIAGFFAVLCFHQPMAGLLHAYAIVPFAPYGTTAVPPPERSSVAVGELLGRCMGDRHAVGIHALPHHDRTVVEKRVVRRYRLDTRGAVHRLSAQGTRPQPRGVPHRLPGQWCLGDGDLGLRTLLRALESLATANVISPTTR